MLSLSWKFHSVVLAYLSNLCQLNTLLVENWWSKCFYLLPLQERLSYTSVFLHFLRHLWLIPGDSDGKESAWNTGEPLLIPGLGRSPGEGSGYLSSSLAQRIPWTVESGGRQFMRSQRVSHNWVANIFIKTLGLACQVIQNILLIFDWDCIKSVEQYWQNQHSFYIESSSI